MKQARIMFAIAAALVLVGVFIGAWPVSQTVRWGPTVTADVQCGSVFFPKDEALLVAPSVIPTESLVEECEIRFSERTMWTWVFIGSGVFVGLLGFLVGRSSRVQSAPIR